MRIKDLEIISDDIKLKHGSPTKGLGLTFSDIPQKPSDFFTASYKNYFMAANFPGGGWIVLLNKKAKDILDLIDGRHSIAWLYDDYLKNTKEKLSWNDFSLFFKKKMGIKEVFIKTVLNRPIVDGEEFLKFLKLLKRTKLIYSSERKDEIPAPENQINVWLHLTNQCNFRCGYCYVAKTAKRLGEAKAFLIIDEIFKSAEKNNMKKISIRFGGGEPLLEFPTLKKIIDYIFTKQKVADREIKLDFVVLTNGALINEEFARFIKEKKGRVAISIDAVSQPKNEPKIEKTVDAVREKIDILLRSGIRPFVMTVVSRLNLKNLPDLANWLMAAELPFRFIFVRKNPLIGWGLIPKNEEIIETISKIYDMVFLNMPRLKIAPMINNGIPRRYSFLSDGTCGVGRTSLEIDENGDIFPCHVALSQKNMKVSSFKNNDPNLDVYSVITSEKIKAFNPGVKGKTDCKDCRWRYICFQCPMSNFFESGRASSASYYCPSYKILIPKALELEAERLIRHKRDE